jgi:hypothetical protein
LEDVWNNAKRAFFEVTRNKYEQLKRIELVTGGMVDFWSMEDPNSGRGRKYHRAIIDEFEKAKRGQEAWEATIRPTLTDYRGDAWLQSTPKGLGTYFHHLFEQAETKDNWSRWQLPTSDNPHISLDEIEEARGQLAPLIFEQEYLAQFVKKSDKPWMYAFEETHISDAIQLNEQLPVYLSFDFNIDPMTCTAHQFDFRNWYYTLYEFTSSNTGTEELCKQIKGSPVGHCYFIVTGDATGRNRTSIGGNTHNYHIIQNELGISSGQIQVPTSNPAHSASRTLSNSILSRHQHRFIHPRCEGLIRDLRYMESTDNDDPKAILANSGHLLDTLRYMDNSFFTRFISGGGYG